MHIEKITGLRKRILKHGIILILLVLTLTGCGSIQSRVSDCQQMLSNTFSAQNRIPRKERQVLSTLNEMAQGGLAPPATGMFPCKSTPPPCQWAGVTCTSGHVTTIDFADSDLSGEIPPELGSLSQLDHLILAINQLSGEIPPELANLSKLQVLYLTGNYLSGEIPPELGGLSQLNTLDLSVNQLSGEIPPELGSLSQLVYLSLSGNQLSGKIPPELGNLSNLDGMSISNNRLNGAMPAELGNLPNLAVLSLSGNQLTGEIPTTLGELSQLRALDLHNNPLSGPLPHELTRLPLNESHLSYTDLCVPQTAEFEAWMVGIMVNDFEDVPYCE